MVEVISYLVLTQLLFNLIELIGLVCTKLEVEL